MEGAGRERTVAATGSVDKTDSIILVPGEGWVGYSDFELVKTRTQGQNIFDSEDGSSEDGHKKR